MNMLTKNTQAIQMIGTQRSGSNLLRMILNQSPDISAPHPPHILDTFFPILNSYSPLDDDATFSALVHDVCRLVEANPVQWNVTLDRKEIFRSCKKRSLVEIFRIVYERMAKHDGASFFCCKSMVNATYFKEIEHEDIKPFYVHLLRDGRDVASSFRKVLVGEKHPYQLGDIWKKDYLQAKEIEKKVGKARFITIRYESLITDPLKEIDRLNAFFDLNLDSSTLNYYNTKESKNTADAGYMWKNVNLPIIKENYGSYKKELTRAEIEIFERVAGDVLLKNGYDLEFPLNIKAFTPEEIHDFEKINETLKAEIKTEKYLALDVKKRGKRRQLLKEIGI